PAAQDAAEQLDIEYRELPAVVDAEEALRPGAALLHDDIPGNLCFDYEYGDEKAVEEAFARAAHVARLKLESTRVAGNPIEPKSCVVAYDAATGGFDVYAPTQGMSMMRPNLGIITGTPLDRIRLHHGDVGGGFGIRSQAYPEYCALMLAARSLGKPSADARRKIARQAGEMGRHPLRDPGERSSRPRHTAERRARARPRGQVSRAARALDLQHGRLPVAAGAADQQPQSVHACDERLPHPRPLWPPQARAHQHHADDRLPRRGAAGRFLSGGAAGRRGGARDRHRPHRAASAQPDSEG